LRIKDPKEVSRRNLEAFLYHVSYFTTVMAGACDKRMSPLTTHSGTLQDVMGSGFRSPQKEKRT
jgi:DNA ligase (NAD+)